MLTEVPLSDEEVRSQLARLLGSVDFRNSKRSQQFLQHVVDCALGGDLHALKETTLGSALFGRAPGYDASSDPCVRVRASDVRKRLAAYYSGAGTKDPVRIELAAGSYLPKFGRAEETRASSATDEGGLPLLRQLWAGLADAEFVISQLDAYANRVGRELKRRMAEDTGGDAVLLLRGGRVVDCDAKALQLFGCRREELVGRVVPGLSPSGSTADVEVTLRLTGGPETFL
jgi:PAS domain-containing protein